MWDTDPRLTTGPHRQDLTTPRQANINLRLPEVLPAIFGPSPSGGGTRLREAEPRPGLAGGTFPSPRALLPGTAGSRSPGERAPVGSPPSPHGGDRSPAPGSRGPCRDERRLRSQPGLAGFELRLRRQLSRRPRPTPRPPGSLTSGDAISGDGSRPPHPRARSPTPRPARPGPVRPATLTGRSCGARRPGRASSRSRPGPGRGGRGGDTAIPPRGDATGPGDSRCSVAPCAPQARPGRASRSVSQPRAGALSTPACRDRDVPNLPPPGLIPGWLGTAFL